MAIALASIVRIIFHMTQQIETDDASERFSLLELDLDQPPPVASIRCPKCQSILAGVRLPVSPVDGFCRLCDRSRPLQPHAPAASFEAIPRHADPSVGTAPIVASVPTVARAVTSEPVTATVASVEPDLDVRQEIATMDPTEDAGPDLTSLPSDLQDSIGTAVSDGATMASAPTAPTYQRNVELATDVASGLRERIVAARARRGVGSARNLTPAQQRRIDDAATAEHRRALIDGAITIALKGGDGKYAHGCYAAWRPSGERSWSSVADAVIALDLPGINPPAKRSPRSIAADAVRALEGNGYRVAVMTRGSRWSIYRQNHATSVGGSVGETCVVASFNGTSEDLTLDGPEDLCAVVRKVWHDAQDHAMIGSLEITAWLVGVLSHLRATDTVYGRFVPPGPSSDTWIALASALKGCGIRTPSPPAAVASRADVADEIADGIKAECDALIGEISGQRTPLTDAGKDLGIRAAITRLDEIASLRAKIATFECLIGPMSDERARLTAIEESLASLVDPTAQRGAMIEAY